MSKLVLSEKDLRSFAEGRFMRYYLKKVVLLWLLAFAVLLIETYALPKVFVLEMVNAVIGITAVIGMIVPMLLLYSKSKKFSQEKVEEWSQDGVELERRVA